MREVVVSFVDGLCHMALFVTYSNYSYPKTGSTTRLRLRQIEIEECAFFFSEVPRIMLRQQIGICQ